MRNLKYLIGIVAVLSFAVILGVYFKVIKLPYGQYPDIFEGNNPSQYESKPVFSSGNEREHFVVGIKNDEYVADADRSNDEYIKQKNIEIRNRILSTLNKEDYRLLGREENIWLIPFFSIELNRRGYDTIRVHPEVSGINEEQLLIPHL